MIIRDRHSLSKLINLAIASAKLRSICVKEKYKDFNMRPQIHILLSGNPGSNKSTVLYEIASHFETHPYNDITDAGLIGSIDKNMHQFTPGASWTCRNSVMVQDEFEFIDATRHPKPIIGKLLSLTEHEQYFKKKVGQFSPELHEKDGDLFLNVKNGEIEVKTNFSLIIGTMDNLRFHAPRLIALKSRCVPIRWKPDVDIIIDIANGTPIFTYEDLLKKSNKVVTIENKDYEIIKQYCIDKNGVTDDFLRILGDLCRVFAIIKWHDFATYDLIIGCKKDEITTR